MKIIQIKGSFRLPFSFHPDRIVPYRKGTNLYRISNFYSKWDSGTEFSSENKRVKIIDLGRGLYRRELILREGELIHFHTAASTFTLKLPPMKEFLGRKHKDTIEMELVGFDGATGNFAYMSGDPKDPPLEIFMNIDSDIVWCKDHKIYGDNIYIKTSIAPEEVVTLDKYLLFRYQIKDVNGFRYCPKNIKELFIAATRDSYYSPYFPNNLVVATWVKYGYIKGRIALGEANMIDALHKEVFETALDYLRYNEEDLEHDRVILMYDNNHFNDKIELIIYQDGRYEAYCESVNLTVSGKIDPISFSTDEEE